MAKVVVMGGGYAGLACLIELSRQGKNFELHLLDGQPEHCKITNLHKTLADPITNYLVPYERLADRFQFKFHQQQLPVTLEDLVRWQEAKTLPLAGTELDFDWLVVSIGAKPVPLAASENTLQQSDLRSGRARQQLQDRINNRAVERMDISLVGGGATGMQVLFELHDLLRKARIANQIRLIDLNPRLIPGLPAGVHGYLEKKLRREGIEYLPGTRYLGQDQQEIHLAEAATGRTFSLPSELAMLFPGVTAPLSLDTNPYGQVMAGAQLLPAIFAAGDCSQFHSSGLNSLTAQAAVRKGKLAARNILGLYTGKSLQQYRYREKGYLVSLGAGDAVGWVGLRCNLARGLPAIILKEAMETQYDLFLRGVDTYLGAP